MAKKGGIYEEGGQLRYIKDASEHRILGGIGIWECYAGTELLAVWEKYGKVDFAHESGCSLLEGFCDPRPTTGLPSLTFGVFSSCVGSNCQ